MTLSEFIHYIMVFIIRLEQPVHMSQVFFFFSYGNKQSPKDRKVLKAPDSHPSDFICPMSYLPSSVFSQQDHSSLRKAIVLQGLKVM